MRCTFEEIVMFVLYSILALSSHRVVSGNSDTLDFDVCIRQSIRNYIIFNDSLA